MASIEVSTPIADGASQVETVKDKIAFRNYIDSQVQDMVCRSYNLQHTNQTYEYASTARKNVIENGIGLELPVWEACELLNHVVDESDPDASLPQIHHLLQTAEAIRKAYPGEEWDWFHLTGLVHDLGKLLALPQLPNRFPQWAVVGDTFPVGCRFHESNVFHEFFQNNPDNSDPRYNTECGVYEPGCGLRNIVMSWGHDEYFYQVCIKNKSTLPPQALYMIRFHSFYPWHKHGAYSHLMDEEDKQMLPWVLKFNQFDLYSKDDDHPVDVLKLKDYYQSVIKKYFPEKIKF